MYQVYMTFKMRIHTIFETRNKSAGGRYTQRNIK